VLFPGQNFASYAPKTLILKSNKARKAGASQIISQSLREKPIITFRQSGARLSPGKQTTNGGSRRMAARSAQYRARGMDDHVFARDRRSRRHPLRWPLRCCAGARRPNGSDLVRQRSYGPRHPMPDLPAIGTPARPKSSRGGRGGCFHHQQVRRNETGFNRQRTVSLGSKRPCSASPMPP